ncbi:hypothetical protein IPL85_06270 [Candidatus Saccharibacteria bacterium]|nr:MAG: hypothetical protein IPL85_06270 [Candidatus Saccharibacteria bacterium]
MSNWVIASNPATYNAEGSLQTNNQMDWVTSNKFAIGDVVYVRVISSWAGGFIN